MGSLDSPTFDNDIEFLTKTFPLRSQGQDDWLILPNI